MRHVCPSVATLIAPAILLVGGLANPAPLDGLLTSAAHAQSKVQKLIEDLRGTSMPKGIAKTNGRIEATQVDVAAKYAGRLATVTVNEGDEVTAGQVIARISSPEYEAQLRGARAQVLKAKQTLAEAVALIAQRKSDQIYAKTDMERGQPLVEKGYLSKQMFDQRVTKAEVSQAALEAAEAQHESAQFAIVSAQAEVERIEAILVDLTLLSPRSGRVQYLIRRSGEVVDAGTRIVTILDLSDVYMTFFLPTAYAGRVSIGDEVRLILDAAPQYVIPAKISFISDVAQFTPKTVETATEREKLTFRIKAQIPAELLRKYITQVKTGLPGMAYIRLDREKPWPDYLQVKL